jgi:PmbA protein
MAGVTRTGNLEALVDLITRARAAGADAADAMLAEGTALSVQRRLGEIEHVERSEKQDLGLRVFVGKRAAIVSASTVDPSQFATLAERAVAMARVLPEDPFGGLAANPALPAPEAPDLIDPEEPGVEALIARAAAAEDAALAVAGVTNSEGTDASWGRTTIALATSAGFAGEYARTTHSVTMSAVAGSGTGMQQDFDYASAVHAQDLADPATIGRVAAERAVARLEPRRPRTTRLPVVYADRVAGSMLSHLASAANGATVARGTSFLRERIGQALFGRGITVRDDPRRRRGLRSRPFDAEGVATSALALVEDGVLASWLLDWRSARQLGLASTGHAARGTASAPSPGTTNLYLEPGALTPTQLMADIAEGLYVTDLIGSGVNGVTGDYSRGAAGFMIRNGVLAEPVAEITIAGNLIEMFARLTPANDLVFRRGTDSPTLRVEGMTMAGS